MTIRRAAAPSIEAAGVGFGYRRDRPVLHGLHLAAGPGERVAVTGPSGTGKSTLLYVLGGMLRPQAGEVLVGGRSLYARNDARRAAIRSTDIGFVFQDAALDPRRTVLDAVLEPCLYAGVRRRSLAARAAASLGELGVTVPSDSLPGQISGGQAQRVAVCRALLLAPKVVLADEPTGNLDRASAAAVLDAFERASVRGTTVVVATHDDRVLARCTRVVEL